MNIPQAQVPRLVNPAPLEPFQVEKEVHSVMPARKEDTAMLSSQPHARPAPREHFRCFLLKEYTLNSSHPTKRSAMLQCNKLPASIYLELEVTEEIRSSSPTIQK